MRKNSVYNTVGGLVKLSLGLLSVPFLTRSLGVESYGLYATISAIINIALFSEWSASIAVTVLMTKKTLSTEASTERKEENNTLSASAIFVSLLSVGTALFVLLSASSIAFFFENLSLVQKNVLEKALRLGSIVIFARFTHQFFIGILQAHKAYGLTNILSTFYTIISVSSSLYIAATSKDLVQIQLFQLVIALSMTGVYWICCQYAGYLHIRLFMKPKLVEVIELSKYGFKMWLTALGSTLFSQFDRIIILRLFGAEFTGLYSALTSLTNQINVISSMPIQPLLPLISEHKQDIRDKISKKLEETLSKAFTVNACLIVIATVTLIFFSNQIVALLFTKYSYNSYSVRVCLIVITCAYSLYSFNATGYFTLLAIREERYVTQVVVFSGIITLVLIYVLSLKFGVLGACFGNIGYSFTLLLNNKALRKLNVNIRYTLSGVVFLVGISLIVLLLNALFNVMIVTVFLYVLFITAISAYVQRRFNISDLKMRQEMS